MSLQLDATLEDFDFTVKLEVSYEVDRDGFPMPGHIEVWYENKLLGTIEHHELSKADRYRVEELCRDDWVDYEVGLAEQQREWEAESRMYDEDARIYPEKLK